MSQTSEQCFRCREEKTVLHPMTGYPHNKMCTECYLDSEEDRSRWNNQETKEK